MELFKLFGTIAIKGADDVKKQMKEAVEEAAKFGKKISDVGGKISDFGGKLTAGLSVPLAALGTLSVKAAADVKAANSQFEQTFGDLQGTASDAISRIAEDAGILDARLKGVGTSIYAFAKSSGAESAEAMALMEEALKATADAAAYYDRSLDDTSESLMSFLKGNYANDAALGVSCTETTRNAKAMELFGKKFNDLSEIQKQQTLLKMVTDAQELSGAMGQAARESDGFENVMGNMKESARMLAAEFGEVLLPKVIELMQKLTGLLQSFNGMDEGTKKLILTISGIAIAVGPVLTVIGKLVTLFGTLQPLFAAVGVVMSGISAPVLIVIGVITALIAAGVALYQNWDVVKAKALELYGELQATFGLIRDVITEIMNVIWSNIVSAWENIRISITSKISAIVSTVSGKFEEVKNSITNKINAAKDAVHNAIEAIKGFFNFEFKWPNIPLPHFSISPSGWKVGDLLDGVIPTLGVEWYAKGGVLEGPTAFGINGNKLMVGGEAGPEAVAPIDVLQKYIAEAVAAQNTGLVDILQKILAAIISNNEEMKDKFMEALEEMRFDINNREFARLVKAVN